MRRVVVLAVLASSSAASAEIIPAGGKLPPEPSVWVELPAPRTRIRVTDGADPIPFTVDTRRIHADGREWVAIYIGAVAGTVTVTAGATRASYTIDTTLKRDPDRDHVELTSIALERIAGRDHVVIEAI